FADRFSSKSIAYLPGYSEPMSIAPPPQESLGALEPITLPTLGEQTTTAALWHPHGFTMRDHLPLILFLDGPDYVNFAHADHVLANLVASRAIPPCRALFYPPQKRNEEYSANPGMPDFLTVDLPAALADHCPVPDNYRERFAIGASLAGLCLLHADFNRPNFFGGLLLQSGSYFQPQSDWMETDFPYFLRITGFVHTLLAATRMPHQHLPALHMTCGLGEENISNNRAMADNLARLRYPVRFVEHPDAHNWTSWQHCLGPGLIHLLNHASAK
ncbi:MAG TPA: alpha/beta hydrolase-fold protein, partial [Phycisphaerales bacterium]|nr:alpha/beta hydrolase-fold protein [Phycisphaerales bacterium]